MILRRNAAAAVGTVKCPVVVPSPLSCRLSDAFDRASLFLGGDEVVLVGVDDCLVRLDGLDGASGDPAELVGVEPLRLLHQRGLDLGALVVS